MKVSSPRDEEEHCVRAALFQPFALSRVIGAPGSSKHPPETSSGDIGSGEICKEQTFVGEVATTFCS